MNDSSQDRSIPILIVSIAIVVPILVGVIYFLPSKLYLGGVTKILPHLNATLNSITTFLLLMALVFIKKGKIIWHQYAMSTAMILGGIFLISYVLYHVSEPSAVYGDANQNGILSEVEKSNAPYRNVYLFVLLSHILFSLIALPLVLISYLAGLRKNFVYHKKIVKYAFPVWLYVSVTGVLVYFMISPYY